MIEIRNLCKTYGSRSIFNNFDLSVNKGEMVAITGNSGSGKSTLLNIIASIENFDTGTVVVCEKSIRKMKHQAKLKFLREDISLLFQNYALMEGKTVYENISMNSHMSKSAKEQVRQVLADLNLQGRENQIINTLSGGEQQRVALARIVIKPSKLLLADEPTGNLDEMNAQIVWETLLRLKQEGKTILVVTHDNRSLHLFDHVIYL